jgi:HEAT repeat protein
VILFSRFFILLSPACRIKWFLLTSPFPLLICFSLTGGCYQDSPSPDRQTAVDLLVTLLDDRDTFVRRNAAEALGKIGDLKSKPFLLAMLDDSQPAVREAAARSLGWLSGLDSETRFKLTILLQDSDMSVQRAAAQTLSRY